MYIDCVILIVSKGDIIMETPTKMKEIINKYNKEINDFDFDIVYQELYYAGGKAYIKYFTELLTDAEVPNKNPLYVIIGDKLYKRVD